MQSDHKAREWGAPQGAGRHTKPTPSVRKSAGKGGRGHGNTRGALGGASDAEAQERAQGTRGKVKAGRRRARGAHRDTGGNANTGTTHQAVLCVSRNKVRVPVACSHKRAHVCPCECVAVSVDRRATAQLWRGARRRRTLRRFGKLHACHCAFPTRRGHVSCYFRAAVFDFKRKHGMCVKRCDHVCMLHVCLCLPLASQSQRRLFSPPSPHPPPPLPSCSCSA